MMSLDDELELAFREAEKKASEPKAVMNIKCYFPGCQNPIIGQCPGYPESCGKFYCEEHSQENHCLDCHQHVREDRLIEKYLALAKSVWKKQFGRAIKNGGKVFLILFGITFMFSLIKSLAALGSLAMLVMIVYEWIVLIRAKKEIVAEIAQSNPGFDIFFKEWSKHKMKEGIKWGVVTGLTLGLGAIAAIESREADERMIRRAVENGIRNSRR